MLIFLIILVLAALFAGFFLLTRRRVARPQKTVFIEGLDPAQIEERHPLSGEGRAELTPENLETLEQWEIDQLYARLDAGPIPEGPFRGRFFFADGGGPRSLADAVGGILGAAVDLKLDKVNRLGEALWKGKVFYKSEGILRNMIDHEGAVQALFGVDPDEVRKESIHGRRVALLFPAKLYHGESLYDPRRDSVIIDYAETDTIEGYVEKIDRLAGRDVLAIRDEVRRIRPGFYLGRAYSRGKMLLTFSLYSEEAVKSNG